MLNTGKKPPRRFLAVISWHPKLVVVMRSIFYEGPSGTLFTH